MHDRLEQTYDRRAADLPPTQNFWTPLRELTHARRDLLVELQLDAAACRMGEELTLDQIFEMGRRLGHIALAMLGGER